MAVVIAGAAVSVGAPVAGAKILPIASVQTSTSAPTAGVPFSVVVRLRAGRDFVDAGWENVEITIHPVSDLDAQGWPAYGGTAVPIHRVGFGVFRGTATVRTPGDYVVADTSAIFAREEVRQGAVDILPGPAPVRIHVVAVAHSSSHHAAVLVAVGAALLLLALGGAFAMRRRGARRSHAVPANV